LLYLQPQNHVLDYAVFVSGNQPFHQSWHYQTIDPSYSPGFELGLNYNMQDVRYTSALHWTHLNTSDSAFKQANQGTDLATLEFVAPTFEMSPPVFGIKRADAKATFGFDSILFNVARIIDRGSNVQTKVFAGMNLLRIDSTLTTVFSDYAGAEPTFYSYALPADPAFRFQLKNTSNYLGVGPDVGIYTQYKLDKVTPGFGVLGQLLGSLTVGTLQVSDKFTSNSARLNALGIGTSHQEITVPNVTQVVPAADGRLGLFYNYEGRKKGRNSPNINIEVGYRLGAYLNAIGVVEPETIVQSGTHEVTPEFSTGTMAIVSTESKSTPFNFNGPYIDLKIRAD